MFSFSKALVIFLFITLSSCSETNISKKKHRKTHEKGEFIYRESDEFLYELPPLQLRPKPEYPWEENTVGNFPRITKEFFRCRGSSMNSMQMLPQENGEIVKYLDCEGKHSLPIEEEKEFVYPILISLLNHIQKKTNRRVVITCGHRCPKHNAYADSSINNRTSKHMIGAEVDFYVQNMEDKPEKILDLLLNFYRNSPEYFGKKEYQEFSTYEGPTNVSTPPLRNKEVYIKLCRKDEGRDFDNRHSYPYICIQVRYDNEKKENVFYTWNKAYNHYFRW